VGLPGCFRGRHIWGRMRYIQTFWSGPAFGSEREFSSGPVSEAGLYSFAGGWLSAEYHWMSWALSSLQAFKLFGSLELITDTRGREMLVDVLGLPYTAVSTALDEFPGDYPAGLFSMAKIYAYGLQREPFLHLDGDLILWERPAEEWLKAPLFCQNIERELFFYRVMLERINERFSYIPALLSRAGYADRAIYSCNAGLFGGSSIDFIQQYCRQASDFIERNRRHLDEVQATDLNFIYEQYLLYRLAVEQGIGIATFLPEVVEDVLYKELVRFQEIPAARIIHPVGGFKRLQWVCDNLARCLRDRYPGHYYRIIGVMLDAGVPLRCEVYERMDGYRHGGRRTDTREAPDKEGFSRTKAAVAYLSDKYGAEGSGVESLPLEGFERECLEEVRRLEMVKNELRLRLFGDNRELADMYHRDEKMYRSVRLLYSCPPEERMASRLCVNPNAVLLQVRRKWVNDRSTKVADIISLNFGSAEREPAGHVAVNTVGGGMVALTPSVIDLSVQEYYLDELDTLMTEVADRPILMREMLHELRVFFDAAELQGNEAAFGMLIDDCVKRLLFAGVLILVE